MSRFLPHSSKPASQSNSEDASPKNPSLSLPLPFAGGSSTSLQRQGSHSSQHSGRIPSPRPSNAMLPPAMPMSTSSSASGSKSGSFISTPRLLSRRGSAKERDKPSSAFFPSRDSAKGKGRAADEGVSEFGRVGEALEGWKSPMSESGSGEVIETPSLRIDRDPGTGKKMVNQYLVLDEIGHGTHGRVRLGRDMNLEIGDDSQLTATPGTFYAIKIVDRNPKKKRLTGFTRQRGMAGKNEGGNMLNQSDIRKEIAIFKKVNHPNVVRMKEIIDDPDSSKLFMILEYCEGGEVHWREDDGSPALTVDETRRIFRDTLLGLEYLHHQGIIHRDIKPSNLLYSGKIVKISDFGCSHYSEALQAASAQSGPDGDAWVDDVELAKTAGSPAFFAPEMCYSGLDSDLSPSSTVSPELLPMPEIPAFTLRPPSVVDEMNETKPSKSDPLVLSPGGRTFPLKATISNDSALARRPVPDRGRSSASVPRRERLPITNAIDVWALGVTLYCLLFGKTPFDAPNEYLLMQVIPTAPYDIPPFMGKDRMSTGRDGVISEEASECLDLLARLLEKDPFKRIKLERAKKHPFTLRGLADPGLWLASTDPHAQTFVTVSSDEVAAVVTKLNAFGRMRRGLKTFSQKLQLFSSTGRSRSRSIGEGESAPTSKAASTVPSAMPSQISLVSSPKIRPNGASRANSATREVTPIASPVPVGSISRRVSLLASRETSRSAVQLSSPSFRHPPVSMDPRAGVDRPHSSQRGLSVPRTASSFIASHAQTEVPPSPAEIRPSLLSSSSLDKLRGIESSPTGLRRRQSEVDVVSRNRSASASSYGMGFGNKLVRLLSRNGSQRSRIQDRDKPTSGSSDIDESAVVSAGTSPNEALRRLSLDEGLPRRSVETFESGSYSGRGGIPSPDHQVWESRMRRGPAMRRGSNLSEGYTAGVEDIDWGDSDDEDYGPPSRIPPSAPNFLPLHESGLGLRVESHPMIHASSAPALEPIPDVSPPQGDLVYPVARPLRFPPSSPGSGDRSPSRASMRSARSPKVPPERARSPLRLEEGRSGSTRLSLSRQTSSSLVEEEEADEGLAISVGSSRRGRKESLLGKRDDRP